MTYDHLTLSTLGLVVHPRKDVAASVTLLTDWATGHGVRVVAPAADLDRLGDPRVAGVSDDEFAETVDGVIALGGDGTMLGAMRRVSGLPTPVMGVNHGNLGFLVEVDPAELPAALDRLELRQFTVEPHDAVQAEPKDGDPVLAFNDLVLASPRVGGSVRLDVTVQAVRYGFYRADAVVVATATGSTAYNYAAGGPVLSPSAGALVITPVAPINGLSRALVIGGDEELTLSATGGEPVALLADGIEVGRLEPGTSLDISALPSAARVVRLDVNAHTRRSQIKLSLLDLPITPEEARSLIAERAGKPFEL